MFWVTTASSFPSRSHSASFLWAALGFAAGQEHFRPVKAEKILQDCFYKTYGLK